MKMQDAKIGLKVKIKEFACNLMAKRKLKKNKCRGRLGKITHILEGDAKHPIEVTFNKPLKCLSTEQYENECNFSADQIEKL